MKYCTSSLPEFKGFTKAPCKRNSLCYKHSFNSVQFCLHNTISQQITVCLNVFYKRKKKQEHINKEQ